MKDFDINAISFADEESKINYAAVMRGEWGDSNCRKMLVISAKAPGCGKSALARHILSHHFGEPIHKAKAPFTKRDWKWFFDFYASQRCAYIDDFIGSLDTPEIANFLTADLYLRRPLYSDKVTEIKLNCRVVITGNEIEISPDMLRRATVIRLRGGFDNFPSASAETEALPVVQLPADPDLLVEALSGKATGEEPFGFTDEDAENRIIQLVSRKVGASPTAVIDVNSPSASGDTCKGEVCFWPLFTVVGCSLVRQASASGFCDVAGERSSGAATGTVISLHDRISGLLKKLGLKIRFIRTRRECGDGFPHVSAIPENSLVRGNPTCGFRICLRVFSGIRNGQGNFVAGKEGA